ncbi:UDP-N-acetylglucosamine 2-epimerase (non-hydrolyzing) [Kitasatospora sp. NPDC002040]|uniref:non-hydrolyzing UDP-N-acetylglucosamine 2-epimerase n=1 Tax=Kitasatospora sp. NPDC002040 TaxID=3154661 RepID=UPI0033239E04
MDTQSHGPAGAASPGRALRAHLFAGTRPEIVKLAPVALALRAAGAEVRLIATGQHHDQRMAGDFFTGLGVEPDARWTLAGDESERVAALLGHALAHFSTERPDVAVVQGDTWTVPLTTLAARRHGVPVAHVEAGLRSGNPLSPEESNRKVAAALATVHLAPTEGAAANLRAEGVPADAVHLVGNTVCDVLRASAVPAVPPADRSGILVTAHRPGTVDTAERLTALVAVVRALADRHGPVVFPVHPRTADRLAAFGLTDRLAEHPGIILLQPQPHRRMLELIAGSGLVVTDSGGLQEEAGWFGVPAVVLRESTPRPEGVALGQALLAGLDPARALTAATTLLAPAEQLRIAAMPCPYGDGRSAERIAGLLTDRHHRGLLALREPGHVPEEIPG